MKKFIRNLKRLIPGRTRNIDLCWLCGSILTIFAGAYFSQPWVIVMGIVGIIAMAVKIMVEELP